MLGLGRGIGRNEYEGFRVDQATSRERFTESAELLVTALETGVCEYDGRIIKQPRRDVRPKPFKSFKGRTYGAAVSPESAEIMGKLGLGLLITTQRPWKDVGDDVKKYRALYRKLHGTDPPAPVFSSHVFCDKDGARAEAMARQYIGKYYETVLQHYEIVGDHFSKLKGHEHYVAWQRSVADKGAIAAQIDDFLTLVIWGTPDQCYEKAMAIHAVTGAETMVGMFSYAGMPYADAEQNLRLFAGDVAPRLKHATGTPRAA
jgi:alkanesulfonate monooxygenase SsuD/methylene tetrahydromethanopterin reductase-like flavin-dependent oxidoreductase (luciferase family)